MYYLKDHRYSLVIVNRKITIEVVIFWSVTGSAKLEITKEHVVGVTKVVEALEESVRTGGMIAVQY